MESQIQLNTFKPIIHKTSITSSDSKWLSENSTCDVLKYYQWNVTHSLLMFVPCIKINKIMSLCFLVTTLLRNSDFSRNSNPNCHCLLTLMSFILLWKINGEVLRNAYTGDQRCVKMKWRQIIINAVDMTVGALYSKS